jgi:hypothetical protein
MHRVLSDWLFGVVDDTARAALMLALDGAGTVRQARRLVMPPVTLLLSYGRVTRAR